MAGPRSGFLSVLQMGGFSVFMEKKQMASKKDSGAGRPQEGSTAQEAPSLASTGQRWTTSLLLSPRLSPGLHMGCPICADTHRQTVGCNCERPLDLCHTCPCSETGEQLFIGNLDHKRLQVGVPAAGGFTLETQSNFC